MPRAKTVTVTLTADVSGFMRGPGRLFLWHRGGFQSVAEVLEYFDVAGLPMPRVRARLLTGETVVVPLSSFLIDGADLGGTA